MIPTHHHTVFSNQLSGNSSNSSSPLISSSLAASTPTAGINTPYSIFGTAANKFLPPTTSQSLPPEQLAFFNNLNRIVYPNTPILIPNDPNRMEMIQHVPPPPQWSGLPKITTTTTTTTNSHPQTAAPQLHHLPPELMDHQQAAAAHQYYLHQHQQAAAAAAAASLQNQGITVYPLPPQTNPNCIQSPYQYPAAGIPYYHGVIPPGATNPATAAHINNIHSTAAAAQQHQQQQQQHHRQAFSLQPSNPAAFSLQPSTAATTSTTNAGAATTTPPNVPTTPIYRIQHQQHQQHAHQQTAANLTPTFVDEASATLSPSTDDECEGLTHMQKIVAQFYKTLFQYHPNTTILSQDLPLPPTNYAPFSIVYTPNIPSKFLPPSSANSSSTSSPAEAFDASTPKESKKKSSESKKESKKEKEKEKKQKSKKSSANTTNNNNNNSSSSVNINNSNTSTTPILNISNSSLNSNTSTTPHLNSSGTVNPNKQQSPSPQPSHNKIQPEKSIISPALESNSAEILVQKESSPPTPSIPNVVLNGTSSSSSISSSSSNTFATPFNKNVNTTIPEETTTSSSSNGKEFLSPFSNLPSIQIKPDYQNLSIPFIQPQQPPSIKLPEYTITPIMVDDDKQTKSGLGSFDYFEPWADERKNSNPYSSFFIQESRKNSIGGGFQDRKNSFLFNDRKNSASFFSGIGDLCATNPLDNSLPLLNQYFSNSRRSSMEIKPLVTSNLPGEIDLNFVGRKRSLSQDDIHFDDTPNTKLKVEHSSVAT